MNFSSWSIKNPIPAVMLFVLLTLAGLMSFKAMKVQNFPDLELPTVSVSASLPGAAPAQLETEVARKLENDRIDRIRNAAPDALPEVGTGQWRAGRPQPGGPGAERHPGPGRRAGAYG